MQNKIDPTTQRKISAIIETDLPLCNTEQIESDQSKLHLTNNNLISEDEYEFNEDGASQLNLQL